MRRLLGLLLLSLSLPAVAQAQVIGTFTPPLSVPLGGTANTSCTAYSVMLTGTTSTGAFKLDLGTGTSGQVLTSGGAGAYPSWQTPSGVSGGAANRFTLWSGSTTVTYSDALSTDTGANTNSLVTLDATGTSGKRALRTVCGGGSTSLPCLTFSHTYNDVRLRWDSSSAPVLETYRNGASAFLTGMNHNNTTFVGTNAEYTWGGSFIIYDTVGSSPVGTYTHQRRHTSSKWTTMTGSAVKVATIYISASTVAGATFLFVVEATDAGGERQVLTTNIRVSTYRKATGNGVPQYDVIGTDLTSLSAGTLSCTPSVTGIAAGAELNLSCTSSLTTTTFRAQGQVIAAAGGDQLFSFP